ncbi:MULTISPECIES: OmpA family protein [Pseudomonas]|uniref:OmpA family protein n=1 Tax=Pseudomonas TaxID=286 RepID=UPI001E3405A4|nr:MULTISPECIES: OmpA family protein [Pseudomonas]MCE1117720.1 OmpA family protein [Pseudomonas sp. NMI795_08]
MTTLFERRIRLGGDPHGFEAYKALEAELAKLGHPACPDVDWAGVEALCVALFERNGIELQSAAAFVMARAWRAGLMGMSEGLGLLTALLDQWPHLWPTQVALRIDLLAGLCARLQPLVRAAQWSPACLAALPVLASELARLEQQLMRYGQACPATLQALRGQVGLLLRRVPDDRALSLPVQAWNIGPQTAFVSPEPLQPAYTFTVEPPARRRGASSWLLALGVLLGGVGGVAWQHWQTLQAQPAAIQLDSLSLFEAGSTQFGSDATRQLVKTLVDIKARPGWLIVIAGHADGRGGEAQNLDLSRARATVVRDWLQRMGEIPGSCFAVQGLAASRPLASNGTPSGRAANRRVDIRLVPQVEACGQGG